MVDRGKGRDENKKIYKASIFKEFFGMFEEIKILSIF